MRPNNASTTSGKGKSGSCDGLQATNLDHLINTFPPSVQHPLLTISFHTRVATNSPDTFTSKWLFVFQTILVHPISGLSLRFRSWESASNFYMGCSGGSPMRLSRKRTIERPEEYGDFKRLKRSTSTSSFTSHGGIDVRLSPLLLVFPSVDNGDLFNHPSSHTYIHLYTI